ncbi:hypothetical protein PT974_07973 [Cladobotryum mycophilum]|uniref:Uncharacterized protein n=1 Tax=Cladobotryum mycophilum TaxID=491253 RepID=A0ABR0SC27_9HYPO
MRLLQLLPLAFALKATNAQTDPLAAVTYVVDDQRDRLLVFTPGECYSPLGERRAIPFHSYNGFESVKTRPPFACTLYRDTGCTDSFVTTFGGIGDVHREYGVSLYSIKCLEQVPEL